jgi:hypothetical protein
MAKSNTTTNFEKVGTTVAKSVSSRPVLKGTQVKKVGEEKGGMIAAATANHRANIDEVLGAHLHPQATLYKQNAAEASQVQRRTYVVPSKAGYGDFYNRQSHGD